MAISAQDAVDAFDSVGDAICHNQVVTARLQAKYGASPEDAANGLQAAIGTGLLEFDSTTGFVKKP